MLSATTRSVDQAQLGIGSGGRSRSSIGSPELLPIRSSLRPLFASCMSDATASACQEVLAFGVACTSGWIVPVQPKLVAAC